MSLNEKLDDLDMGSPDCGWLTSFENRLSLRAISRMRWMSFSEDGCASFCWLAKEVH